MRQARASTPSGYTQIRNWGESTLPRDANAAIGSEARQHQVPPRDLRRLWRACQHEHARTPTQEREEQAADGVVGGVVHPLGAMARAHVHAPAPTRSSASSVTAGELSIWIGRSRW